MKIQITITENPETLSLRGEDEDARIFLKEFLESEKGDIKMPRRNDEIVVTTWTEKEHRAHILPEQQKLIRKIFGGKRSLLTTNFEGIHILYDNNKPPSEISIRRNGTRDFFLARKGLFLKSQIQNIAKKHYARYKYLII